MSGLNNPQLLHASVAAMAAAGTRSVEETVGKHLGRIIAPTVFGSVGHLANALAGYIVGSRRAARAIDFQEVLGIEGLGSIQGVLPRDDVWLGMLQLTWQAHANSGDDTDLSPTVAVSVLRSCIGDPDALRTLGVVAGSYYHAWCSPNSDLPDDMYEEVHWWPVMICAFGLRQLQISDCSLIERALYTELADSASAWLRRAGRTIAREVAESDVAESAKRLREILEILELYEVTPDMEWMLK